MQGPKENPNPLSAASKGMLLCHPFFRLWLLGVPHTPGILGNITPSRCHSEPTNRVSQKTYAERGVPPRVPHKPTTLPAQYIGSLSITIATLAMC